MAVPTASSQISRLVFTGAQSLLDRPYHDSRANHHARCATRISHVLSVFVSARPPPPPHSRATPFPCPGRCTSSQPSSPSLPPPCHPLHTSLLVPRREDPNSNEDNRPHEEEHHHVGQRDADYIAREARMLGGGRGNGKEKKNEERERGRNDIEEVRKARTQERECRAMRNAERKATRSRGSAESASQCGGLLSTHIAAWPNGGPQTTPHSAAKITQEPRVLAAKAGVRGTRPRERSADRPNARDASRLATTVPQTAGSEGGGGWIDAEDGNSARHLTRSTRATRAAAARVPVYIPYRGAATRAGGFQTTLSKENTQEPRAAQEGGRPSRGERRTPHNAARAQDAGRSARDAPRRSSVTRCLRRRDGRAHTLTPAVLARERWRKEGGGEDGERGGGGRRRSQYRRDIEGPEAAKFRNGRCATHACAASTNSSAAAQKKESGDAHKDERPGKTSQNVRKKQRRKRKREGMRKQDTHARKEEDLDGEREEGRGRGVGEEELEEREEAQMLGQAPRRASALQKGCKRGMGSVSEKVVEKASGEESSAQNTTVTMNAAPILAHPGGKKSKRRRTEHHNHRLQQYMRRLHPPPPPLIQYPVRPHAYPAVRRYPDVRELREEVTEERAPGTGGGVENEDSAEGAEGVEREEEAQGGECGV
ncbi:hypothetical protein FB451DRAFT_1198301 [Mycena latifolia]|nr:hypothetical protein FB451DRAFT_1198301 [Mycena latifolia]